MTLGSMVTLGSLVTLGSMVTLRSLVTLRSIVTLTTSFLKTIGQAEDILLIQNQTKCGVLDASTERVKN